MASPMDDPVRAVAINYLGMQKGFCELEIKSRLFLPSWNYPQENDYNYTVLVL